MKRVSVVLAAGTVFGCGVKPLGAVASDVPAAVELRFRLYCGVEGCHAGGATQPNLSLGSIDALIGASAPMNLVMIELGNLPGSYIARKIDGQLGPIEGGTMPPLRSRCPKAGRSRTTRRS